MEMMIGRLRDWVAESRADMRSAPTHVDWLLDAVTWLARWCLLVAVDALGWRRFGRRREPVGALPSGHVPEASPRYALSELYRMDAEHDAARVEAQRTGKPMVWP